MAGDRARELERVAGVVGELDHFVALIVMAENDESLAERRARRGNAQLHLVVGQPEIGFGQRLPFVEALLFHVGENGKKGANTHSIRAHRRAPACELVKFFAISGREKTKRRGPATLAGAGLGSPPSIPSARGGT